MIGLGGWKGRNEKDGPYAIGRMAKSFATTPRGEVVLTADLGNTRWLCVTGNIPLPVVCQASF